MQKFEGEISLKTVSWMAQWKLGG